MPNQSLVIVGSFAVAIGLPMYYTVKKRRAAGSLNSLLAERFSPRKSPVSEIHTKQGPVRFSEAYDDTSGAGLVLVLGYWVRSRTAYNRVAGVFKPGGDAGFLEKARSQADVLLATGTDGGALIVWKNLPSRASVLAHLESLR